MPRRVYTSEVRIDAPVEEVWETLIDLPGYRRWNPFTIDVRSRLEVGGPVDMKVRMLRLGGIVVSQRETLRAIERPSRLVWGMRMLGGAIEAERVQTLTATDGGCVYRTEDTIEGSLGGLVFGVFGSSIQAGFDAMAEALRDEVGRRARSHAAE